jgi:hypothetical protein
LIALVAALAIAGCGGDDDSDEPAETRAPETQTVTRTETAPPQSLPAGRSDEQEIQAVWRRYTAALGEEDGETVCSLLTENGKTEVLRGGAAGSSCEEVVEEIGSFFKGFETELTDVRVQGDVAEAVSPRRGQISKQGLGFRRVDGEWKIDRADDLE